MQNLGYSITRKGHVRRIYALKRIIHTPKAHGAQEPRQYALYGEVTSTAQRSNVPKKCIFRCTHKIGYA